MTRTRRRAASATEGGTSAFTLIELLVVIGIIGLLLGIAVPTISQALRSADATKTLARIKTLSGGAEQFHNDHQYYPGQKQQSKPGWGDTGPQWLAYEMFTEKGQEPDPWEPGTNTYIPYKDDWFCPYDDDPLSPYNRNNVLSDGFGRPRAILYWPSIIGGDPDGSDKGTVDKVYRFDDCRPLVRAHQTPDIDKFREFAWDERFNKVRNHDSYLLLGAGPDRKYFTGDDISNTGGS